MEIKPLKVQADIMWAFLDTPNQLSGKYQVDLCNLTKSAVDVLKSMGLIHLKKQCGLVVMCGEKEVKS